MTAVSASRYIRWFEEIGIGDVSLVGGKNASLGELYRELAPKESKCRMASQSRPRLTGICCVAPDSLSESRTFFPVSTPRMRQICNNAAVQFAASLRAQRSPTILRPRSSPPTSSCAGADLQPARCRRPQQRHGRGSAGRELRRPAGDLSQRPGRAGAAGDLPALLRLAVHRPRDLLPRGQGVRSPEGRSVHRRAAHGALRPRDLGRHVHASTPKAVSATRC